MPLPAPARLLVPLAVIIVVVTAAPSKPPSPETPVHVRGLDFALEMPDSLRAGTHVWQFQNAGSHRHEFILARLKPGADPKATVDTLHARGLRAFFAEESPALAGSALFAPPGMTANAEIVTHDRRGDVLLAFCQLRDSTDKPKHDDLGMFKVVHIR